MPTVKVSGGERFMERFETQQWLDRGALDIIQTDCNVTGLTENWFISRMAHLRGISSIPHNWHGGGTTMANAHFVAGMPNAEYCELNQTYNPLKEGIFKEPLTVVNGMMTLPDKPGFGVELIDDVEERFPFEPGSYLKPNERLSS
jgi:galactonate dehydratase